MWLLEASGWRQGVPELGDTYVPRVNVLDVQAPEGGAGEQVLEVPLSVTGTLTGTTIIEVQLVDELTGEAPPPSQVVLEAGDDAGVIPISYVGDTAPGGGPPLDRQHLGAERRGRGPAAGQGASADDD